MLCQGSGQGWGALRWGMLLIAAELLHAVVLSERLLRWGHTLLWAACTGQAPHKLPPTGHSLLR